MRKLKAEARTNPDLASALGQIDTGSERPATLGITSVLQGGADQLNVLVGYNNGGFTAGAESTIEWMVDGVDTSFSHSAPADPGGNTLGPFAVGQTVKLRTRVTNSTGTTTGSVRSLKLLAPPV